MWTRRCAQLVLIALVASSTPGALAAAPARPDEAARATMQRAFSAMAVLLPASAQEEGFSDPAKRAVLRGAFAALTTAANDLRAHGGARDASFGLHARNLADDARPARSAFERERSRRGRAAKAEAQLAKLGEDHRDLIDVTVDVERATAHHRKGQRRVEIRCQARAQSLVATGAAVELDLALRNATRTLRREVEKLRAKRRDTRSERSAEPPLRGVIDRVAPDQGHGFLITDAGERVYFHRNAACGGLRFDALEGGESVALNYEAGEHGLQATFVRPLTP